ncbi:MAG: KamA family radical SAM protein [Kiritimatiellae bacterium]|nr:KamA family radical SAM protein [Kiritimatiellia bacterium]
MGETEWNDWRWQLRHAERTAGFPGVEAVYPFFLTPYGKTLLRFPSVRKQMIPDPRELRPVPGCVPDPFAERGAAAKCFGVKQRFPDRVLVMASGVCAMNCRHCTRKGLLHGAEVVRTPEQLATAVDYVRGHPRVRDVLLSGGDPLTLPDGCLRTFVEAFVALPQIDVVRVCTRIPSMLPMRVTPALARLLAKSRKVWVNTQFNCAEELTPEAVAACGRLVDAGIPVSCQTVLLRGVNDSVGKLFALCAALQRARVRPYYVFVCDPVSGIGHFRIPLEKAKVLERRLAERIGGLAFPRFVADLPGSRRKVPLADLGEGSSHNQKGEKR